MINLSGNPFYLTEIQIDYVKNKVKEMPLKEKIGQLFFVIGQDGDDIDISNFINKYQPGGIMFRPNKSVKIKHQIMLSQSNSNIPLFIAANLESGGNGLVKEGTWFGTPLQIAATDEPKNAYNLGKISGSEAFQVGGNMAFAPIVDIDKNFRNPITNTRTFGSDEDRVLSMSQAQVKGLKESRIVPVIKHFPGDGVDERDQHLVTSINSLDVENWSSTYGKIYEKLIDQGVPSIMIGHIMQPAWEKKLNPKILNHEYRPASCSRLLINGLLRRHLNFNGLVITDATPMIGYNSSMARKDLLPASINAGIDMILFNKNIDEDYQYIFDALESGVLKESRIDEAVMRIIATKISQKIMDTNSNLIQNIPEKVNLNNSEHFKLSEIIARDSITLVKDREQLLPVTTDKYPRIRLVVLGDTDDGGFKEGGRVTEKFKSRLETIGFEVTLFDRRHLDYHEIFEEGVKDLREKFDLALYVANIETASNQTTTRLNWIQLMAADAPWFMKDIPTIFISTANPYHLFDIPNISTYINAYTGNEATIDSLFRKLIGKEAFIGKSPVDPFCGQFDTKL